MEHAPLLRQAAAQQRQGGRPVRAAKRVCTARRWTGAIGQLQTRGCSTACGQAVLRCAALRCAAPLLLGPRRQPCSPRPCDLQHGVHCRTVSPQGPSPLACSTVYMAAPSLR
jgi:hypothetical protein